LRRVKVVQAVQIVQAVEQSGERFERFELFDRPVWRALWGDKLFERFPLFSRPEEKIRTSAREIPLNWTLFEMASHSKPFEFNAMVEQATLVSSLR
jgi:hypothetical protein